MERTMRVVDCYRLPDYPHEQTVYRLLPKYPNKEYYEARTDRNIGWISRSEQTMLWQTVIGIAGCGGMGAQLAEKFLRLGVGEIRIADNEQFDVSNINRQFGATRGSVGKSKAFETAKLLRTITDDSVIVVYPQGITPQTTREFISGCDVICDEIEFWCAGARIGLHQSARHAGVPVFVCNTIGFGSHVFLFTPTSLTMEECLGLAREDAVHLEQKILRGHANDRELNQLTDGVIRGLFPAWTEYETARAGKSGKAFLYYRLRREKRCAIVATNPALACGFVADRVLLHLLQNAAKVKTKKCGLRIIAAMPEMPGYLYFDAATMQSKIVKGKWW